MSSVVCWLRVLAVGPLLLCIATCRFAAQPDGATYQALVQRVKNGDFTIDFRLLRLACIKSSHCEPRGTKEDLLAMSRAEETHDFRKVVEIAERLIDQGFVNLEAHATCSQAYAAINEPAKAKFHLDVTTALMHSIFKTGDGKTRESAFEVICDREEYDMMVVLGLPYFGTSVLSEHPVSDGPHHYDKWDVRNPKTGQNAIVFFNTDAFSPTKSRVGSK